MSTKFFQMNSLYKVRRNNNVKPWSGFLDKKNFICNNLVVKSCSILTCYNGVASKPKLASSRSLQDTCTHLNTIIRISNQLLCNGHFTKYGTTNFVLKILHFFWSPCIPVIKIDFCRFNNSNSSAH